MSWEDLTADWKRSIIELPDDLFFSLMRRYLGDIKTPFHKPRLMEKAAALLSDRDTALRIAHLTDRYDAELLSAIEVLNNPTPGTLYRLFKGERDYFSFHNHLMNLHERLLIYTSTGTNRLCINPFLYQILKERVITPRLLFPPSDRISPADPAASVRKQAIGLTEEHIWSMISFICHQGLYIKTDGTLKKNCADQLEKSFPVLCPENNRALLYRLLNSMMRLKLIHFKGGQMHLHEEGLQYMAGKSRSFRNALLWAASCLEDANSVDRTRGPEDSLGACESLAEEFLQFFSRMPLQTPFSLQSVRRLLSVIHLTRSVPDDTGPEFDRIADEIISVLTELHILTTDGEDLMLNPAVPDMLRLQDNHRPLLLHPDFTVTVQPPLDFRNGLFIAVIMKIISFAAYPQFELSSESYIHGRRYFSFQQLSQLLSDLSASDIPQNINFSLEAWEQNYSSVQMIEGILLQLAKHWDRLVVHNPDFKTHVLKDLGHGLYVMNPESQDRWRYLLEEIGITPLPPVEKKHHQDSEDLITAFTSVSPNTDLPTDEALDLSESFPRSEADSDEDGLDVKAELMQALERLNPPESLYRDLSTQIEKKLILYPAQLKNPVHEPSASEARGVDYAGKVRIIQQSLQSENTLLELIERTAQGKPARHLLRPTNLEKSGQDLVLIGEELPGEKSIRIRVEKIGYVKKWRNSLFIKPRDYRSP